MKVFLLMILAALRAVFRRIRYGTAEPTWGWAEEVVIAMLRTQALTIAPDIEKKGYPRSKMQPPMAKAVAQHVELHREEAGGVEVEWYRTKEPSRGTIFYLHGGGYVAGSVAEERRIASAFAMAAQCDTVSVEYRLAPEFRYPAALEDSLTAYRATLEKGADPKRLICFGGSAGAGLALATLLKIREAKLPMPGGAVLIWPYADLTFSGESVELYGDIDLLPSRDAGEYWAAAYAGEHDRADPFISPVFADLTDLPPLLIMAGGVESCLSDAKRLAQNAKTAGVDATLSIYPHKVHAWMMMPWLRETKEGREEVIAWIEKILGAEEELLEQDSNLQPPD